MEDQVQPVIDVMADVVDALMVDSESDVVGLWQVPWLLTRRVPGAGDAEVRRLGELVVRDIVGRGLLVGDLSDDGFVAWDDPTDVDRVLAGWDALGTVPNIGDVCYFALPGW